MLKLERKKINKPSVPFKKLEKCKVSLNRRQIKIIAETNKVNVSFSLNAEKAFNNIFQHLFWLQFVYSF